MWLAGRCLGLAVAGATAPTIAAWYGGGGVAVRAALLLHETPAVSSMDAAHCRLTLLTADIRCGTDAEAAPTPTPLPLLTRTKGERVPDGGVRAENGADG